MITDSELAYGIGELVSIAFLALLLASSTKIKHYSSQQRWFNASLLSQIIYLAGDSINILFFHRISWTSSFLPRLMNSYLSVSMNALSFTTFMFIAAKMELPLVNNKKTVRLVSLPAVALSIFDVLAALFAPQIIFTTTGAQNLTSFYSIVFISMPALYSGTALILTFSQAYINRHNRISHYYLTLTAYPLLMTSCGAIELFISQRAPIFAYSVTFYFAFIYLYQLNSTIEDATIDSLTGLRNRENLKDYLDSIWRADAGDQYYLFMIDMNGLKSVNDVYGHVEGDNAIKAIGKAMDDVLEVGNDGIVCRYGGDEFIAIIKVDSDQEAAKLIQLTRERIAYYSQQEHLQSTPQVAAGYIRMTKEKQPLDNLLKQADSKMYAEKQSMKTGDRAANFFTDEITGLPNANYFHNFAGKYLKKLSKEGKQASIVLFNVAGMHAFNDQFGYKKGDELLRKVSRLLHENFREEEDVLLRYTEDNFLLVTTSPIEPLLARIKKVAGDVSQAESVGLKAGIYQLDKEQIDVIAAVDLAKRAMQSIGKSRQQIYAIYGPAVQEIYDRQDFVLLNFKKALQDGEISAHFQPVIRSLTGQIASFEALARWENPERGLIPPDQFISTLEKARLIQLLDLEIFEQVCQQQARAQKAGLPIPVVSVNLSPIDLQSRQIVDDVEKIRQKYGIPAKYLKIEVLESIISQAPEELEGVIEAFHECGYKVWMDDFGSGYSSLNNLKDFSFDLMKIDMEFLKGFTENSQSKIIISEVVDMAKRLGIATLCEGIENRRQSDFLKEIGCQFQQGYLFGKSMTADDLQAFLAKHQEDLEAIDLRDYYGQIDRINVLTNPIHRLEDQNQSLGENIDVPMAVVELGEDDKFTYLYFNHTLKRLVIDGSKAKLGQEVAAESRFNHCLTEQMHRCQGQEDPVSADFTYEDVIYKVRMRWLAKKERDAFIFTLGQGE
ncbi:bifunctional diguanylate cyclase/phosphodiesterase [Lactobacillus sp.]|uniref:bifunctional diguanylate cyclase/phosphodiesterase n=1 Tax=Lactobacillus sp. TaxID=1591 RepID=UPI003EF1B34C